MSHHGQGEHSGETTGRKSHLPAWLKRIGIILILWQCAIPVVDGIAHANWFGVALWCLIGDLLCQFVWEWS